MARRYAIIGTGALGGYYGGLLAKAGFEVHFHSRSDHKAIKEHGLTVNSKDGDFHIPDVNVYANTSEMPECDVTIVAIKTTANACLSELLPPVVGSRGVALVLQNGLRPEADTVDVIGEGRVLGGCCFLRSTKVAPGKIVHLDYGPITLGEYRPANVSETEISSRLQEITGDLCRAGIMASEVDDLWRARFTKLVWNVPFNGLSVVHAASTDELIQYGESMVRSLMEEVVSVAKTWKRDLGTDVVEKMIENTRKMKPYDSSMRIDWEQRRPMELDAIYGSLIRAAGETSCRIPCIEMLYRQLKFLESRRV